MTPRARLSTQQRKALEAYVQALAKREEPLPGARIGDVDAINWAQVAEATGIPKQALFRHLEEAKAILQPHLEAYGVTDEPEPVETDSIEDAARRYLEELRTRGEGIPALPRRKGPYFDWKTIAREMDLPYPTLEANHHILRRLFHSASEELGFRLTQPAAPKEKPKKTDPLDQAIESYIHHLRTKGQGVPVRCLNLSLTIDWSTLCQEFDCPGLATTTHRREVIARRLLAEMPTLGARYHSEHDRELCELASRLRKALEEASPETLRGLITQRDRLRWRAVAQLIDEPLETLLPHRLRLRALVEEYVRERLKTLRQAQTIEQITQRVERVISKMRQQNSSLGLLNDEGELVIKHLAREIRLKSDILRPHRPWLEAWLRSCIHLLFERR
ncbi:hypothetical protein [Oceanithermus sp.]|uniref:hypothetical protein n=1 Tax=Oceanithermus sp. TaxID=2268145 RepID=UPI00257E07F9|nr:hypothetical protein [Oceanithermus sp.]